MAKYMTKSHIIHNGVMVKPGNEIELTKKDGADRLVELKAIELIESKKEKSKAPEAPQEGTDGNPGE